MTDRTETEDVIKKLIDQPIQLGITPIHHMRVIQLSWENWSGRTAPDYLSITREIVEEGVND